MYREINENEVPGKIVEGFLCAYLSSNMSGQMIMYFKDKTFITFEASRDYDGESSIILSKIDWLNFGFRDDLIESGVISEEEIDDMAEKVQDALKKRQERNEREHYQRLKAKYGG